MKKKEMIPPSEEETKSYEVQDVCHICKKKFCLDENENDKNDENENNENENDENENDKNEKYRKVKDHNNCNLRYKTPREIPIAFHNGSTYDYHFIIKQLAEEFKGEFECIGETMEKYITFSVPIKKM